MVSIAVLLSQPGQPDHTTDPTNNAVKLPAIYPVNSSELNFTSEIFGYRYQVAYNQTPAYSFYTSKHLQHSGMKYEIYGFDIQNLTLTKMDFPHLNDSFFNLSTAIDDFWELIDLHFLLYGYGPDAEFTVFNNTVYNVYSVFALDVKKIGQPFPYYEHYGYTYDYGGMLLSASGNIHEYNMQGTFSVTRIK